MSRVLRTRVQVRHRLFVMVSVLSNTVAQPCRRQLHFPTDPLGGKHVVDKATELIGDEIADHGGAISGRNPTYDWRSASLAPFQSQTCLRVAARLSLPAHRYPAAGTGQRTVLRSVGCEFMQNHRQG